MELFLPGNDGKFHQAGKPEFSLKLNGNGNINLVIDGNREVVCGMLLDAMKSSPDAAACIFTAAYARLDEMGRSVSPEFKKLTYFNDPGKNGLSAV